MGRYLTDSDRPDEASAENAAAHAKWLVAFLNKAVDEIRDPSNRDHREELTKGSRVYLGHDDGSELIEIPQVMRASLGSNMLAMDVVIDCDLKGHRLIGKLISAGRRCVCKIVRPNGTEYVSKVHISCRYVTL